MSFFNYIFFGWYLILGNTIYSLTDRKEDNVKLHSYFISYLLHGINLWSLARYVGEKYFDASIELYVALSLAVAVFIVGYIITYRTKTVNNFLESDRGIFSKILSMILAILYSVISIYIMILVGDYIRHSNGM